MKRINRILSIAEKEAQEEIRKIFAPCGDRVKLDFWSKYRAPTDLVTIEEDKEYFQKEDKAGAAPSQTYFGDNTKNGNTIH